MGGNNPHYASGRSGLELSEALYSGEPFKEPWNKIQAICLSPLLTVQMHSSEPIACRSFFKLCWDLNDS